MSTLTLYILHEIDWALERQSAARGIVKNDPIFVNDPLKHSAEFRSLGRPAVCMRKVLQP